MWLDSSGQELVETFWRRCGEMEGFPRSLERPLALALPVALIKLPRLRLQAIESWVRSRGIAYEFGCKSRAVRGCLIAHAGHGLLFVDGADPEDERRFTVAHEIAHFLTDYWLLRTKAVQELGPGGIELMDGMRPPTVTERIRALLGSTRIGAYQSLMERGESHDEGTVWDVENRADRVALSLLAPPEEVLALLKLTNGHHIDRLTGIVELLRGHFGLPEPAARAYGQSLLHAIGKGASWVETLGLR